MMTRRRRATIRPFLRGPFWWARIPRLDGQPSTQRSLGVRGTDNRDRAEAVCAVLWALRARREAWILHAMADGKVAVGAMYDAHNARRLDAFIAEQQAAEGDPDLAPMVAAWQKSMAARKRPRAETAAKYVAQVRFPAPA
jgi:hypothetical protein